MSTTLCSEGTVEAGAKTLIKGKEDGGKAAIAGDGTQATMNGCDGGENAAKGG